MFIFTVVLALIGAPADGPPDWTVDSDWDTTYQDYNKRLQKAPIKLRNGKVPRRRSNYVKTGDRRAPGNLSPVEMWHEAVKNPKQRRLAAAGRAGDHRQSVFDLQAHVVQRRLHGARVRVGQAA